MKLLGKHFLLREKSCVQNVVKRTSWFTVSSPVALCCRRKRAVTWCLTLPWPRRPWRRWVCRTWTSQRTAATARACLTRSRATTSFHSTPVTLNLTSVTVEVTQELEHCTFNTCCAQTSFDTKTNANFVVIFTASFYFCGVNLVKTIFFFTNPTFHVSMYL